MSRLENSAKNIALSMSSSALDSLLGIISRTVFISVLGAEYLGLAGLLNNVLGFLTISELGIATAIGYSLYKPLAQKNYSVISSLMSLYRKAYRIIAVIVFFCGVGLFFFLDFFVPLDQQPAETTLAYFTFLINTVLGYLLSYKSTLIASDNQAFRLSPISMVMAVIQSGLQIICLLAFKSYTVYLFVLLSCSTIRMVWVNRYVTKRYPQVNFQSSVKLGSAETDQLKRNVGGLVISKIGDYLVNSTDNLIITKLVSLAATGIYSNYLLIRNIVNGFIGTIFSGITASMGNVVATESDDRKLEIFETLMFSAFFLYSFEAVCFMCLFNTFIGEVWLSKKYLFNEFTVAIIVFNNYLTGLRIPLITMKGAAGKHLEDAWIPFAFAIVNLLASIILVRFMGVAGVFLGTIIGSLLTADWYRPIIIYKHVFHASVIRYYKVYLKYVALGMAYVLVAKTLCNLINCPVALINLALKAVIAVSLPILLNFLVFRKEKEFQAIVAMYHRLVSKIKKVNN